MLQGHLRCAQGLAVWSVHEYSANSFFFFIYTRPRTQASSAKPEDPYKDRKIALGTKLRDIIFGLRNDPTTPNPANKAMETAVSIYRRPGHMNAGKHFSLVHTTSLFLSRAAKGTSRIYMCSCTVEKSTESASKDSRKEK
jgi:hypothetical protein